MVGSICEDVIVWRGDLTRIYRFCSALPWENSRIMNVNQIYCLWNYTRLVPSTKMSLFGGQIYPGFTLWTMFGPVLLFQPEYRSSHPENYLFSSSTPDLPFLQLLAMEKRPYNQRESNPLFVELYQVSSMCEDTILWMADRPRIYLLHHVWTSASFLAEISVKSPRKLFIFIIQKKCFLDQSIKKKKI